MTDKQCNSLLISISTQFSTYEILGSNPTPKRIQWSSWNPSESMAGFFTIDSVVMKMKKWNSELNQIEDTKSKTTIKSYLFSSTFRFIYSNARRISSDIVEWIVGIDSLRRWLSECWLPLPVFSQSISLSPNTLLLYEVSLHLILIYEVGAWPSRSYFLSVLALWLVWECRA